jgi:hypothetical protein
MCLLVGQLSDLVILDLSLSLCVVSKSHSYIRRSIGWPVSPHGHVSELDTLKRCKYAFMFPCPVSMVVSLCVGVIFIFSLSATIGN